MNSGIKFLANKTVRPLVKRYLSKTRLYRYNGLSLLIPPQVFHPAFFFSTKLLLQYINKLKLTAKTFLELGAGSGLISFEAAKKGAIVTATDINATAIEYLKKNGLTNSISIRTILSDVFKNIPAQQFDIISINPPYYKKYPSGELEYAWYCGENGEYFIALFNGLHNYVHPGSIVLMILCDECDLEMINKIAAQNNFILDLLETKYKFGEKNYIFRVRNNKYV